MLSARTTARSRVVRASSVGWPPSSRTLTQPSQVRTRSGCNWYGLGPTKRRGGRAFDADVDELARPGLAGEVHGRVVPRAPAQERRVGAARALDEHLLHAADTGLVALQRDALAELDQALDPLRLNPVRHLVGHRRRLGAPPRRQSEPESALAADLLHDLERRGEVLLGLAGEADDQVGREGQVWDGRAQLVDEPQITLARVRAAHRLQDPRRAGLERQVRLLADRAALGHRGDDR